MDPNPIAIRIEKTGQSLHLIKLDKGVSLSLMPYNPCGRVPLCLVRHSRTGPKIIISHPQFRSVEKK